MDLDLGMDLTNSESVDSDLEKEDLDLPLWDSTTSLITGSPAGPSRVDGDGQCSAKTVNFKHSPKSQL